MECVSEDLFHDLRSFIFIECTESIEKGNCPLSKQQNIDSIRNPSKKAHTYIPL